MSGHGAGRLEVMVEGDWTALEGPPSYPVSVQVCLLAALQTPSGVPELTPVISAVATRQVLSPSGLPCGSQDPKVLLLKNRGISTRPLTGNTAVRCMGENCVPDLQPPVPGRGCISTCWLRTFDHPVLRGSPLQAIWLCTACTFYGLRYNMCEVTLPEK